MSLHDGRVITNYINCIKQNIPIIVYGDGTQTRSFCYISDMINGLILMMNSSESGPINLGNPNCELTINELVSIFEHILLKNLKKKEYKKLPNDDPKRRKPDISLAKTKLSWEPKISLLDGITKMLIYYNVNSFS